MASTTDRPATRRGLFHRIPVIGTIIRDCEREPESVFYLIVGLVSLVIIGTVTWGLPVLAMSALFMVPVIFVVLVRITLG